MQFQRIYVGLTVKLHFLKKFIFTILLFWFCGSLKAQTPSAVEINNINNFISIEKNTFVYIDTSGNTPIDKIALAPFFPLEKFLNRNRITTNLITAVFYLRFTLQNNSTVNKPFFFYAGKVYKDFYLYKISKEATVVEEKIGDIKNGFVPINIQAHQTNGYLLKLQFFKTGFNKMESKLIPQDKLSVFKHELYKFSDEKKVAGMLLSGMLFMMMLVSLLNYYVSKKPEFLFNSLYSLCMFMLIFFTNYLQMNPGWFKGVFISYLDLLLLISGTIFYIEFTRHFLNTAQLHPKLNSFLKSEVWVLAFLMIVFSIMHFGFKAYLYETYLENFMKIILVLAALVYVFLSFVQKNPLMNYLAIGISTQIFFSIISFAFIYSGSDATRFYNSPIVYFEMGIIFPIVFFLIGLFYKNRQELITKIKEQEAMNLEAEKQTFKNELNIYKAQQEERNRISADMHDDLGAAMTSIRLYSELAKSKVGNHIIPEIEKISASADELINKMNAIIWSMSSHNDSMGNMVAYIRSYTTEYLDNTGIKLSISIPENLPDLTVIGTIRRNIFLVIKEALQNIVKHSNATEVKINMYMAVDSFSLTIHDNGKGIDFNNLRPFSNGLKNMQKRMDDVAIDFSIENNNGTVVTLHKKIK